MCLSPRWRSCTRLANRTAVRANRAPNGREGRGASSSPSTLVSDTRSMRIRIQGRRSAAMQHAQTSTGKVVAKTAEPPERPVEAGLWRSQAKGSDRATRDDPSRPCTAVGASRTTATTTLGTLGLARPRLRSSKRLGPEQRFVDATQAAARQLCKNERGARERATLNAFLTAILHGVFAGWSISARNRRGHDATAFRRRRIRHVASSIVSDALSFAAPPDRTRPIKGSAS